MTKKQKILLIAAAVLVVLGIVLRFFTIAGLQFSFYLCLGLGAVLMVFAGIDALGKREKFKTLSRVLTISMCSIIGLALALFLVLEGLIISGARTDAQEGSAVDCILILGAGVNGTEPSLSLRVRLDAALDYLAEYPHTPVIVSGGQGQGEEITEAEAMRRYLEENGVSPEQIIMEEAASTTEENMRLSKTLMEETMGLNLEETTVAVVTSEYHLYRARTIAQRYGIQTVGIAAETPILILRVNYFLRESAALLKTLVLAS